MLYTGELDTQGRDEMRDITRRSTLCETKRVQQGTVLIYCPHTTAGIAINENADPDVKRDVLMSLDEVYPWNHPKYRHAEGNTASHLKSITCGPSQTVIIQNGTCSSDVGRAFISANSTDRGASISCEDHGRMIPQIRCYVDASVCITTQKQTGTC